MTNDNEEMHDTSQRIDETCTFWVEAVCHRVDFVQTTDLIVADYYEIISIDHPQNVPLFAFCGCDDDATRRRIELELRAESNHTTQLKQES